MTVRKRVARKQLSALFLVLCYLCPPTIFANQSAAVSTVEGQLLMLDCTAVAYNADRSLHFSHRATCLARAKHDHGRLLFPAPNGTLTEVVFDVFIGARTHHLIDVSPATRDVLFKALQDAAPTKSTVYVSVTGTFDPGDKWFNAISVKVLRTVPNQKEMAVFE